MPEQETPVLPATVVAAHLRACAADLSANSAAARIDRYVPDLADLTGLLEELITGQQLLGLALSRLADHVAGRGHDLPARAESADLVALAEVIDAASAATGHAAQALAESRPVLDIVVGSAGPDARL